ncbi:hypothetical protein EVAR_39504_1 [Eumeta japonica]|uniref:Uncharacterized protein n=1 Tax=Eumeta variegata TaxID=151549 RepID=A0A4C1W0A4_EUMVA|nr:hypothetical protein EVAR_39504_1 [Eumeta japonica]
MGAARGLARSCVVSHAPIISCTGFYERNLSTDMFECPRAAGARREVSRLSIADSWPILNPLHSAKNADGGLRRRPALDNVVHVPEYR